MSTLIHASARMEVTCDNDGTHYRIELTDKNRLRTGHGILLLTTAEFVELCRLDDSIR